MAANCNHKWGVFVTPCMMFEAQCLVLFTESDRLNHVRREGERWEPGRFHLREAIDGRLQPVMEIEGAHGVAPLSRAEARRMATAVGLRNEAMTDPKRACTAGHALLAKAWLERVARGEVKETDYLLVLEDDFAWGDWEGLSAALDQIQQAPPPYDLLLLGYRGGETRHWKAPIHRALHLLRSRLHRHPDVRAKHRLESQRWSGPARGPLRLRRAGFHWGSHGYLMNASAARAILHFGGGEAYPADFTIRMIQAYGHARVGITDTKYITTAPELGSLVRDEAEFLNGMRQYPTS